MPSTFEIGESVGDYRIVGVLGAGGSGEVFKAEHSITKRAEAIKVLGLGRPHAPEEEQRFLREIQVQASLDHPNVASVHNAFWTGSGLVLAMELVEGESLETILERGRIPLGTAIGYILQTLSALIHAHAHGVIHRDIKPGNIVVAPRGTVKLTDFGLALEAASPRLTSTGSLAGSPYYMSPEQIDGAGLDARTDVYSLGVVLYEAATGSKPFLGESTFSIMLAHRNSPPVPPIELEPTIGQALNNVILTALAKDPRDRFQTAADFRHALDAARKALNLALPAATSTFSKAEERRAPRGFLHSRVLRWTGVVLAMALGVILGLEFASLLFVHKEAPPNLHAPAPPPAPPVALEPKPQVADTQKEPAAEPESAPAVRPKPARRKTARAEEAAGGPMVIIGHDAAATPQAHAPAVPETASQPGAGPAEPAAAAADKAAPPDEAATTPGDPDAKPAAAAPQKQRHRVWRALGRIVRPWKKSSAEKPQAEEAPPK